MKQSVLAHRRIVNLVYGPPEFRRKVLFRKQAAEGHVRGGVRKNVGAAHQSPVG